MPAKPERPLIKVFLSAYENEGWKNAELRWLEEEQDGAVEVLATRSDGVTLALEHTLIQLFSGEKEDSTRFTKIFSRIERSPILVVPERNLVIFIPIRAVTTGYRWDEIGEELLSWLVANHTGMPEGYSKHIVSVGISSKKGPLRLQIGIQNTIHPGLSGCCLISSNDKVPNDLGNSVEKVLTKKLPKLVKTHADKRILLLERDQIPPAPQLIYDELAKRQATFPRLAKVDEVWFVNTAFYQTDKFISFDLIDGRGCVETLTFRNGALVQRRAAFHGL